MKFAQLPIHHLWTDRFAGLESDSKVLWLHLKANPSRLSEGLYRWHPGHVQVDTGLSPERYQKARAQLIETGYIKFDPDTNVVLDLEALKHWQPRTWRQLKGAVRCLENVPETVLEEDFFRLVKEFAPDLDRAFAGDLTYETEDEA